MSSIQTNTELNLFFREIPQNVKQLSKLLQSMSESMFEEICVLCKHYLRQRNISKKSYLSLKQTLISSHVLDKTGVDVVLNGVLSLAISCHQMRHSFDSQSLEKELIQRINLSPNLAKIFVKQVLDKNQIQKSLCQRERLSYCLRSIRWRIDVSISNPFLSRIMEPLIIFEFDLIINNDINCDKYLEKTIVFEAKISEFHRFRFIVANLIKQLNQIQYQINN